MSNYLRLDVHHNAGAHVILCVRGVIMSLSSFSEKTVHGMTKPMPFDFDHMP